MGNVNQNEETKIFAENLSYYMKLHKVDRVMLANELGFKYTTVCDWCNGKVVPRKNKIKVLANYFSISESDLTWRDNLLTDKNINKKREILVYKDFPTKLSFDKESENNSCPSNILSITFPSSVALISSMYLSGIGNPWLVPILWNPFESSTTTAFISIHSPKESVIPASLEI